ncbi:hypothetical protein IU486_30615 [Streptomyces gardneri]|uniref:hypothetical protein n=1 Tax=Nocardia sputi TaxID=2943705 RepID=UPI001895E560|nr:hypothetical protein [Nocardia sputi]MBF6169063.1 hypothetical protein [Streptomyces gardneri]
MFRRFTTQASPGAPPVDDLVAGALPDRVQIAHERLAHQDDPALLEALSERELAASRELAELVRDYERHEKRARIQAAADAAERVRRTAAELAEREAADLLRAAQAIGEQRHSSSPHAKVARLHQRKPRVLGLLAGVVAFSMLFSAVTVQQNIAPTGGASNPMFWLSYGLEALISAVLVALMLSTGDTAEWGVIDRLWQVYTVEGVLLTASIALNTFPYFRTGDLAGIGIHAIAPIMIGVALVTHRLVAERYGRAIEQATAAVPDHEDLQERLAALTQVGGAGNQILPSILMEPPATARRAGEPSSAEQAPEAAAVAGQHPGADPQQDRTTAAEAGQPSADEARAAALTAVPAPELTELWLATTPFPAVERSAAGSESGAHPPAESSPDEAVLDARLAAAVRQTLDRIRFSRQPEPAERPVEHPTDAATEPSASEIAETADEHGARQEPSEAHSESIARDVAQEVTVPGADSEHVVRSETVAPNGRALEPIGAGVAQHYAPSGDDNGRPARMEQVTPVVAVDKAPIVEEAAATAAATAPRVVNERQLTTR